MIDSDLFHLQPKGDTDRWFDLLVHPRVPPLVRTLPHVESLSLFRLEENQEEAQIRETLGLGVNHQHTQPSEHIMKVASDSMNAETTIPSASSVPPDISHPSSANLPQDQDRSVQLAVLPGTPAIPVPDSVLNPIPPPPPLETVAKTSALVSSDTPSVPVIRTIEIDEDDEEMPAIDLNSDSD